jgi:hypothetical protein
VAAAATANAAEHRHRSGAVRQPMDVPENVDRELFARVLETGREMIAAIDRGEADRA